MNYYNEIDPKKAAWLRELIRQNVVAPGVVDERSIELVQPDDLDGYAQCHFFAGIGIWSYALRCAGWPDDKPVWTGSAPCQPFSAAGQRKGKEDERHLWPAWFRLIAERRPQRIFGEQVSSRDGLSWLDDVRSDLEAAGYRSGALDLCAAGFGGPHIRQRLYFVATGIVADAADLRRNGRGAGEACRQSGAVERPERFRDAGIVAAAEHAVRRQGAVGRNHDHAAQAGWNQGAGGAGERGTAGLMGYANGTGREACIGESFRTGARPSEPADAGAPGGMGNADSERSQRRRLRGHSANECAAGTAGVAGPVNGFWRDAEWVWCRDNTYRPTEPGTSPLAHVVTNRILKLRGYGDGIVAEVATAFIKACMEERAA